MKMSSKWIKELNVKARNYKNFREKHRGKIPWHKFSKIIFDPSPRVMEIKTEGNKWDLIKLEGFCRAK